MYQPNMEACKNMQREYKVIPLSKEISADMITPIRVLKVLQGISKHNFLLESMEDSKQWGRYTFLGFSPRMEITCRNGKIRICKEAVVEEIQSENPGTILREILAEYKSPKLSYLPAFTGGLAGCFAYDAIQYSEKKLQLKAKEEEGFADIDLMLFDKLIAFDNQKQKIHIIVNIKTENLEKEYTKACKQIEEIEKIIMKGNPVKEEKGKLLGDLKPLFDKQTYCEMVKRAQEYIREGDIFQVVLSNYFSAKFTGSLLDTYRVLRSENPSPYLFYFASDSLEIAGASPETLVKLENDILHTFPLAGTRPRGKNALEDRMAEKELLEDEKEMAEHNMLVDLGRNDLGKISRFASVEVENYASILRFSHVMHIGSTVRGTIREDKDAIDAIQAVLPAGTLSGAPKKRACEIIDELENQKRGIYGGAVGYLSFTGDMDTCIAIRLAYKKNGKVFVRSGAGIVAESIPEKEYEECIHKAKATMLALEQSRGGR